MDEELVVNTFTQGKSEETDDAYADFFSSRKNHYKRETIGPMLEARGLDPQLAIDPNYTIPSVEQEQEQEKLTDKVLTQDPNFIAVSKVLWETNQEAEEKKLAKDQKFYGAENVNIENRVPYNPTNFKTAPTEDKDWGKYGIEMMGFFNYNIPHMALDTTRLADAKPWQRVAFYYAMSAYDQLGVSWNGTKRFFNGVLRDPSTYIGLGILGLGARQAGKGLGKEGIMAAVKQLAKTGAITGVESGAYTAIDNFMRQKAAIGAGAQEEFDIMELLKMTGFGTAAGVTLGTALPGAAIAGKNILKKKDKFDDLTPLYHGSSTPDIKTFDKGTIGSANDQGFLGRGFYFASTPGEAGYYGKNVNEYYKKGKIFDLNKKEGTSSAFMGGEQYIQWADKLEKIGMLDDINTKALEIHKKADKHIKNKGKYMPFQNSDGTDGWLYRIENFKDGIHYKDTYIENYISYAGNTPTTKKEAFDNAYDRFISELRNESKLIDNNVSPEFKGLNDSADYSFTDYIRQGGRGDNADKLTKALQKRGYKGATLGDETVIFEPEDIIRSDEFKKKSK